MNLLFPRLSWADASRAWVLTPESNHILLRNSSCCHSFASTPASTLLIALSCYTHSDTHTHPYQSYQYLYTLVSWRNTLGVHLAPTRQSSQEGATYAKWRTHEDHINRMLPPQAPNIVNGDFDPSVPLDEEDTEMRVDSDEPTAHISAVEINILIYLVSGF